MCSPFFDLPNEWTSYSGCVCSKCHPFCDLMSHFHVQTPPFRGWILHGNVWGLIKEGPDVTSYCDSSHAVTIDIIINQDNIWISNVTWSHQWRNLEVSSFVLLGQRTIFPSISSPTSNKLYCKPATTSSLMEIVEACVSLFSHWICKWKYQLTNKNSKF